MKTFLRKTIVVEPNVEIDYGMTLKYYVTERLSGDTPTPYGIKIEKSAEGEQNRTGEISGIFSELEEADRFVETLCRCTVTPSTVYEIAQEYALSKILKD